MPLLANVQTLDAVTVRNLQQVIWTYENFRRLKKESIERDGKEKH